MSEHQNNHPQESNIPASVYNRAVGMSVNGNLNDGRTKAFKYLKTWVDAGGSKRRAIERLATMQADIERAVFFGSSNVSRQTYGGF